ncbi:MAG: dTMP kinase [Magnetococcales bacterium]|nr:dTMP kinase [Magnetococcales bacterium]
MNLDQCRPGRFIVLEGMDGSGKSTQHAILAERLRDRGLRVHDTHEPTSGPIGSLIRQMLNGRIQANHETIAALFAADRIDHLLNSHDGILAKINGGMTVLSDRYYFSSYAYHAASVGLDWLIQANSLSARLLRPDITIFIDVSAEMCCKRLQQRHRRPELYENLEALKAIRAKYLFAFDQLKGREAFEIIDGAGGVEGVTEQIWIIVSRLFGWDHD